MRDDSSPGRTLPNSPFARRLPSWILHVLWLFKAPGYEAVSTCNKIKGSKTDISNTKRAKADYFPEGCIPALKYRSVTDIVRPIHQIVRRREETTGHSVRPKWNWSLLFVRPEWIGVRPRTGNVSEMVRWKTGFYNFGNLKVIEVVLLSLASKLILAWK
jgi:hypothetical protein